MIKFADYIYIEICPYEINLYVSNFTRITRWCRRGLVDVGAEKRLDFVCGDKEIAGANKN